MYSLVGNLASFALNYMVVIVSARIHPRVWCSVSCDNARTLVRLGRKYSKIRCHSRNKKTTRNVLHRVCISTKRPLCSEGIVQALKSAI